MCLSLSIRQLNATYHCSDFFCCLVLLSVVGRLIAHHVFELNHCVRLVIVIVEACHFLVLHLSSDEAFTLLATIEQVKQLLLEVLLEILIISRNLQQMIEAVKRDKILSLGLRVQKLVVKVVCVLHSLRGNLDCLINECPLFVHVQEVRFQLRQFVCGLRQIILFLRHDFG